MKNNCLDNIVIHLWQWLYWCTELYNDKSIISCISMYLSVLLSTVDAN